MIRRRQFIALLGGAAAAWPLAAGAQQDDQARVPLSGTLRMRAENAAADIRQFIREIESQVGRTVQLAWPAGLIERRRTEAVTVLRAVPAIMEIAELDPAGIEQLRVSRLGMDVVGSRRDYSQDPKFTVAIEGRVYYGPVFFHDYGPAKTPVLRRADLSKANLSKANLRRAELREANLRRADLSEAGLLREELRKRDYLTDSVRL